MVFFVFGGGGVFFSGVVVGLVGRIEVVELFGCVVLLGFELYVEYGVLVY